MLNICILFGGVSPEHEVSLRSAESVLNNIDKEKYNVLPVGITRDGTWYLFGGDDFSELPGSKWENNPNNMKAIVSPARDQGLVVFLPDGIRTIKLDCVFPVLHGENGEDGSVQGLMQLAGIPCVGSDVSASAAAMDKTMTKLVADKEGITQAKWLLVKKDVFERMAEQTAARIESCFDYPVFVKPAGTGSSVGVSKVKNREELQPALEGAFEYDSKALVEEFIDGHEIEVAVLGNGEPYASICGEIISGAEFYDYDAKYITDTSVDVIPAEISDETAEMVRDTAVRIYKALGCKGLSRVDFFVKRDGSGVVFNEINTIPGFTSISMYPKLMVASGIEYPKLIDKLIELAIEARM
ncbi:MAG: D-alanine--D-alanine ligase [Ruminococcaceae bacterium]|nr:D-alanine--D-alanine ligase [Oscillospiraceae bacterium]